MTSLALFHCREYGSIRLGPARGKLAKHEGLEAGGDSMQRTFDVQAVREQFPALGRTHNSRGVFLGAAPDEVAFGANMTMLTFEISRALAGGWDEDSEIVVTELDHRANVDPWLIAAAEQGARVRWVRVDPETLTLDQEDLEQNINKRTKLVAIGLASNAVGTVNDVAAVAERAHSTGALIAVDAVHAAPHLPVDRDAIGADIITCSAYKFFGPHVGVTAIRRDLFEKMGVYRLDPAPNHIPDKLETGTQNHEGIAGVKGALDFISSLGEGTSQREKLTSAMKAVEDHEAALAETFRKALRDIPSVKLYATPDDVRKTPTIAFTVQGKAPEVVCARMLEHGFFIAAGDFYASTLAEKLGIRDSGGFVRAGLAPYNTEGEVENFTESLARFVRET